MMRHVCVKAQVVQDETGIRAEIPVILVEQDSRLEALGPLVDYLLAHTQARSLSWMRKLCQAVGLLLDYLAVHHAHFARPADLFDTFARRVYSGTIGEDGRDPSDLYWLPKRSANARQLLTSLSEFSDWLHKTYGTQ
ncbi:hypothetical protein, partial [Chromobacterium vaccinii]|uniref:hypothetical protein n=1 Tax=Chromobacterium vaccinii TaxID=1108595 RepID=UPI003F6982CC